MNFLKYLRLPYVENGSDWTGVDCFGLVVLFYKEELNIEIVDYKNLTKSERANKLIKNSYKDWKPIDITDIKKYDILCFYEKGLGHHSGILLEEGKFIHVTKGSNCVITPFFKYKDIFTKAYRYKGKLCNDYSICS